jgi:glycosyltransferase involved in cell wall biosynthesis
MTKGLVSVIIPSRVDEYLLRTIQDLFLKAEGPIEIIVILDGYWPNPRLPDLDHLIILHHGGQHANYGMREAINNGILVANGEYIMKVDEHCMFDVGFDTKLKADCDDDWVCVPRRYRLDADNWKIIEDGRPPIDYMYIAYPFERTNDTTCGLHGALWNARHFAKKNILIDDTMAWQGSAWFMKKAYWDRVIGPMDNEKYGWFTHEAQEIGFKAQFSGGRLIVNKKTWYAHHHKGKRGKLYGFSNAQWDHHKKMNEMGRRFCIDYWLNNKWEKRIHDFEWLIDMYWPVPTWPQDWREQIWIDRKKENW